MPLDSADSRAQETSPDEDLEDNQSQASTTSTDAYSEHEPFDTYQRRVLEMCRLLWHTFPNESFDIQRLKGGASNRIIAIQVSGQETDTSRLDSKHGSLPLTAGDYILRIPRWDPESCDHEAALLRFISSRISYPVPTVVYVDPSGQNPLGSPFVIQRRILGRRLDEAWPLLTQSQRYLITLDMARLCNELVDITNPTGGIPVLEQSMPEPGKIETIDHPFPGDEGQKQPTGSFAPMSMLSDRLDRWNTKYPPSDDEFSPYKGAMELVQHMQNERKTFQPHELESDQPLFYLNHGDLFPRNIIIDTPSQNTAFITGILDWDDVDFAPAIISLLPPAWLWTPGFWRSYDEPGHVEEEELWRDSHAEPEDEDSRELKDLFDKSVKSIFLQHAYSPDAYAARKIWSAAYESMGKSWVADGLTDLYQEWKASS